MKRRLPCRGALHRFAIVTHVFDRPLSPTNLIFILSPRQPDYRVPVPLSVTVVLPVDGELTVILTLAGEALPLAVGVNDTLIGCDPPGGIFSATGASVTLNSELPVAFETATGLFAAAAR